MSQEVLGETELKGLRSQDLNMAKEANRIEPLNKGMTHFQAQQENNLRVKEAMAKELAAMGLSEDAISQILHLEDEIPF